MGTQKDDTPRLARVNHNKLSLTRKKDEMKMNTHNTTKAKKNNKMSKNKKDTTYIKTDSPFLSPPRIDGIHIVIDMPDPEYHGLIVSEILNGLKAGELAKVKTSIKSYPVAANIPCPDAYGELSPKNPRICIMATPKVSEHRHILLMFNPEKLFMPTCSGNNPRKTAADETLIEYLDQTFSFLCGMGFFDFITHGRVTRLDMFRQIAPRNPDDYMFKVKYARSSQSVFGSDGKLETLYFGKRASNQVAIYDKAREMHGKNAANQITRIEYRLKPDNVRVRDLWSVENPFKKITVHSLKCDNPPFGTAHWTAFQDACRFRGIARAIAQQPKTHRHKLKQAVSTLPISWWAMSDDDWLKYWHSALEDCCLNLIPDHAPPLTMAVTVGMAA